MKTFGLVIVVILFACYGQRIIRMEDLNNNAKILLKTRGLMQNSSQSVPGKTLLTVKGKNNVKVPEQDGKGNGSGSNSGSVEDDHPNNSDEEDATHKINSSQHDTETDSDDEELDQSALQSDLNQKGNKNKQKGADKDGQLNNALLKDGGKVSLDQANISPVFDGNLADGKTGKNNNKDGSGGLTGLLDKETQTDLPQSKKAKGSHGSRDDESEHSQHSSEEIDSHMNELIEGAINGKAQGKGDKNALSNPTSEEDPKKLLLPKSQGGVVSDEDPAIDRNRGPTTILGNSVVNYKDDPNHADPDPAQRLKLVVITPNNTVKKKRKKDVQPVEQKSNISQTKLSSIQASNISEPVDSHSLINSHQSLESQNSVDKQAISQSPTKIKADELENLATISSDESNEDLIHISSKHSSLLKTLTTLSPFQLRCQIHYNIFQLKMQEKLFSQTLHNYFFSFHVCWEPINL